jgi:hypothetical protein
MKNPADSARGLAVVAVLAAGAGLAMVVISQHTHRWAPPPVPPTSAALARQATTTRPSAAAPRVPPAVALDTAPMSRSVPVTVRIPVIGVRARIIGLGLGPGGIVEVPSLSTPFLTSWFDKGAAPGEPGRAVLFGHVDSAVVGPAVFYRLGDLRPGDIVYVTRADHRTAVFRVNSVALYPERDFPSRKVYGPATEPELRLITCGGDFDEQTHLYLDRTIAFASYVGQER